MQLLEIFEQGTGATAPVRGGEPPNRQRTDHRRRPDDHEDEVPAAIHRADDEHSAPEQHPGGYQGDCLLALPLHRG